MKDFNEIRPESITSDNLWQLYLSLTDMERPYIKARLKDDDDQYLYLIGNMTFDIDDEARYTFDDMANMKIPCELNEYLVLHLKRAFCDEVINKELRIRVNTYSCYDVELTAAELLERRGISFPDEADLEKTLFEKDVPVTYIERKPQHKKGRVTRGLRLDHRERAMRFMCYLESSDFLLISDSDCGVPHIGMTIPLPDCAVGCIESSIWFYKHEAEVRTYYPKQVTEICGASEHKGELLRLLNYFNAHVWPDQIYDGPGAKGPQIYLAPRFYMTEDCDVTATTIINYQVWDIIGASEEYIIHYCPQVLSVLAPYVVCVLTGALTADEAIERIENEVLNGTF
ncbi:MAG: hypothetical protein IK128_01695 [Clostridiales bacterium]|nr:hypothetical protein [Clostridiales bacterium]